MARFTIQAGIAKIDEASVIKVHQNGPSQTALRKDEGWVTPIIVRLDCRIEFFHVGWRILEIYIDILYYRFLFIIASPWKISNLTEVSPPPLGIPWKARAADLFGSPPCSI